MSDLFQSVFSDSTVLSGISNIEVEKFLLCLLTALLIGLFLAFIHTFKTKYTVSFFMTLTLLPAIVTVVIIMVNGNIGAGIAVAGAFSLVRFRSAPGTGKEISAVFLAMASGLIVGMGYLAFAVLFALVLGAASVLLGFFIGRTSLKDEQKKTLSVTIPEDLNYGEVFADIFAEYLQAYETVSVKTSNMGSLYRLKYEIVMKDPSQEKAFIDAVRCRNGNLEISITRREDTAAYEL